MNRESSLDALRGLAIVGMVLSGSIAFGGVLPAWMYHAQVPPPLHRFDPTLPGLTWVDLVFPFFLFSMGAAFPLALRGAIEERKPASHFWGLAATRFLLLAFFALFTQHLKAWVIAAKPGVTEHLLSLFAFVLLFGIFYRGVKGAVDRYGKWIRIVCLTLALLLLGRLPFREGAGFDLYKSDIILMVLANMAFFGLLIYYFTARRPLLRLSILPVVAAIILSARELSESPVKAFFNFNEIAGLRFDWLYKFYFLKYLFIVIPGTLAGEWMLSASWKEKMPATSGATWTYGLTVVILLTGLLYLLLYRNEPIALEGWSIWLLFTLCGGLLYWVCRLSKQKVFQDMVMAGWGLLLLGLLLEPYEGGIKKDPSTFSYYFLCGGFAFLLLPLFRSLSNHRSTSRYLLSPLADVGKNPMLAYVAGSLLVLPILSLTGIKLYWDGLTHSPWQGVLKGLLFTGAVMLITRYSVKRKWFWRT
jgi:predicted acyltransferase